MSLSSVAEGKTSRRERREGGFQRIIVLSKFRGSISSEDKRAERSLGIYVRLFSGRISNIALALGHLSTLVLGLR